MSQDVAFGGVITVVLTPSEAPATKVAAPGEGKAGAQNLVEPPRFRFGCLTAALLAMADEE